MIVLSTINKARAMKLLVIYSLAKGKDRKTIIDNLRGIKNNFCGEVIMLNSYNPVPVSIYNTKFDIILYHYTFLSHKYEGESSFRRYTDFSKKINFLGRVKAIAPQDEYVHADFICNFIRENEIDLIYTCFYEQDWEKVYPRKLIGSAKLRTVLTGYFDDYMLEESKQFSKKHSARALDIMYRARKVPYWIGRHGLIKWQLTDAFLSYLKNSELKYSLSNNDKDVFLGLEWTKFLGSSRVVLGCEGGASLFDFDGRIRKNVDVYVDKNPDATFDETEKSCFLGLDYNISLFALSPRHIEACLTKTCQVLVEGKYHGLLKPNIHYIELKKDFSNIATVIELLKNRDYCEAIAEAAYSAIVNNPEAHFRHYMTDLFNDAQAIIDDSSAHSSNDLWLKNLEFELILIDFRFRISSFIHVNLRNPLIKFFDHIGLLSQVRLALNNLRSARSKLMGKLNQSDS